MKAATIAALIALLIPPANHKPAGETEDDARARYAVIAEAVHDVAGDDERLVLFLLTVARHESTFRRKVHSGATRGDNGFAWSLFQLNIGSRKTSTKIPRTEYTLGEIVGVDLASTKRATIAASTYLRPAIKRCKGAPRCVFANYGGLSKSEARKPERVKQLDVRVATYRRLVAKRK
jgi:hypothetical protein